MPQLVDAPVQERTRRPPFIPLLPIALVWLVVAAAAHAPAMIIPIVLLCILSVRLAGWRRRHPPREQDHQVPHGPHGPQAPHADDAA